MLSKYTGIITKHIRASQLRCFTGAHHPSASAANSSTNTTGISSSWTNPDPGSELCVSTTSGFLPRRDPLAILPSYYEKIDELLHEMSVLKQDGTFGLLHTGRFGSRIERELPLYDVEFVFDLRILAALYRDYSMLASAYLLEPCDIQFRLARNYGLARRVLPTNIAVPLDIISRRLGQKPFLEHSSFTLYNYRRRDQTLPITLNNLEPIRRFSGCDKEHNFIVGHVAAARQTDEIVAASLNILRSAQNNKRIGFNAALRQYTEAMSRVNDILSQTLKGCGEYASFHTFLNGCKAQTMFNRGVLFENNAATSTHKYLGVAQSSSPIASLSTHLFQLSDLSPRGSLPCTDGVDYLRAPNYRSFLSHVNNQARHLAIQSYALRNAESSAEYISALGQVLSYRYRQWANLRDSMHIQSTKDDYAFCDYLDVQTCHVRDIAELICRTHANTDFETLPSNLRSQSEAVVHSAEVIHRSLDRIIDTEEAPPLPVSMIAY
ncbi:hypothetical protein H4R24_003530 [Coemansia sp. RSA 988]|nr:hypothetical protein H4R24_003530 [Coemansia sp. RSA 988]